MVDQRHQSASASGSGGLVWLVIPAVVVSLGILPGVVLAITEFQMWSPIEVPPLPFAVLTMLPGILLGVTAVLTMLPLSKTR